MQISFIAIAWSAFAGISLSMGLVSLNIWAKRVRLWSHLAFFFISLSIALILIAELLLLQAKEPATYGQILRWSHIPIFIFIASSVIFLRIYLKAGRLWLACAAIGTRLIALIVNFGVEPNINYSAINRLRTMEVWGGEVVAVAEGVAGRWQSLASFSSIVLLLFVLEVTVTCWRRGGYIERRRALTIGGSFIVVVFAVATNAALVHWGVISQPFYLFGTFILVVLAIGNELSNDVLRTARLAGELQQSQFELRDSERRLDLASAAAAVGAWEWDFNRDTIWASDQARFMYGLGRKGPINFQRFLAALHAEDRDSVRASVMQSIEDGQRFQHKHRVQLPDQRVSWVTTIGRVEAGADGGRRVLRGISVDISAHKLASERFREVVEAAPTGIVILGGDRKIVLVNSQIEKDFGYKRKELIGKSIELLIPQCLQSINESDPPGMSDRMGVPQEVLGRHKSGWDVPAEIGLNSIQGAHGAEMLVTISNITERKRRDDTLQQERSFLRQIIDITPGLLFAKDRTGRFTLVNEAVARIYGTTIDNLIGKTDADFNSNREEVEAFRRTDREVMDTLQKKLIMEEPITDALGQIHWLQTVKLPVVNREGYADQLLGVSTDISERKKADLDLAQQRNELAHLSRVMMLSELSGSLAHELNQPLAAILTNAQAALRFLGSENPNLDEIRDILRDIVSDDRRAGEVIQGLRLLLKKGEVQRDALDPNALVESVLKLLRSDMLNAGVAYSTECAQDLPRISGIGVQLQQVLLNLMVNSCDAMTAIPRPERKLVVSTELSAEEYVTFCVRDRGHGISTKLPDQVFEPFFTTKTQGLGLGLAVCRKLIEAHDGRIWASNNKECGASFYFTVPVNAGGAK